MSIVRVVWGSAFNAAVYAAFLFVPAGTLRWPRAWILIAIVFGAMLAGRLLLLRDDRGLLAERKKSPFQRGQPRADKVLVAAFLTVFPAYLIFIPIDVFRLHVLRAPPAILSWCGLALVVSGLALTALAFRENAFAAGIVRHQTERGHSVVDSGVYAFVRHPLYAGIVGIVVGAAFWLGSDAAAILSIIPIGVIIARIVIEESFLMSKLDEYVAYGKRVRYRLIPGIW